MRVKVEKVEEKKIEAGMRGQDCQSEDSTAPVKAFPSCDHTHILAAQPKDLDRSRVTLADGFVLLHDGRLALSHRASTSLQLTLDLALPDLRRPSSASRSLPHPPSPQCPFLSSSHLSCLG